MKTLIAILAMGVLFVLLLQVAPVLADDGPPDHRPEAWELTATAEAGGGETEDGGRETEDRGQVTEDRQPTATVQPYPVVETPAPYPEPEAEGGFLEWLRQLFGGEWRAE